MVITEEALQELMRGYTDNQTVSSTLDQNIVMDATKYIKDFRKYDPHSFDGKNANPTMAEA